MLLVFSPIFTKALTDNFGERQTDNIEDLEAEQHDLCFLKGAVKKHGIPPRHSIPWEVTAPSMSLLETYP